MTPPLTSTYRLQLGPDLGFDDAAAIVERLRTMGISHLYLSPVLEAAPGSTHGYDTVDHHHISAALGGREGFDRLVAAAGRVDLGIVVDVVPNHMSIAMPGANRWWWDVLEKGPASGYADHFDITWESPEARQIDTVLLPILGDHYGVVLEAGELAVERHHDRFVLRYFDHVLPLSPRSIDDIRASGSDVDARITAINADPDLLHDVLERQHYQLSHWRRAQRDLDYRRFFDIDTLIGLRIEDEAVFADTHALILELVRSGQVDGLRIDHPDGLTDPAGYLDRLHRASEGAWTVVEKILEHGETLPDTWPVAGTTGYDALRVLDGIFRAPAGVEASTSWWHDHVDDASWPDVVLAAKQEILATILAADVARLADVGIRLCEGHRRHRDHTRHDVSHAIRAIVAAMPVYRTYVRPGRPVSAADRKVLESALAGAREIDADVDEDLYAFFGAVLAGTHGPDDPIACEFVERFQQLTGPGMAKSVEDTAFYRHLPIAGANEVGGDPAAPAVSTAAFHRHNEHIQNDWPRTMTALSTHDTKRSADVRARLDALLSMPDRWTGFLRRWLVWCDQQWTGDPDHRTTALLLQTAVGAWPITADRLGPYMEKATKEAKQRTSWTDADPVFDAAILRLVDDVLADDTFVGEATALVADVLVPGRHVALAKQLLQFTIPGVPDCYQGAELWDLSLVDPDNRRPVDHELRGRLAASLEGNGGPTTELVDDDHGEHKLWVTTRALDLRRRRTASFGPGRPGRYEAVDVGSSAVAFRRGDDVIVAAQLDSSAPPATLELPPGNWTDLLTGSEHTGTVQLTSMLLLEDTVR